MGRSGRGGAGEGWALAGRIVALGAVYFVAAKLGLKLAFVHPSATPVWPPAGITLAAFLLLGDRVWPGILAGAFLANLTTAGTALTSLGIAAGNTLEGLTGAWLVRRFAGGSRAFDRPRDVFAFAVWSGLVSTAVSATFGVTSLSLGGFAPWRQYLSVWSTWWLGDAGGDLVVAPLLLLWAMTPRPRWNPGRAPEVALWGACLLLVGLVTFGGLIPGAKDYPVEFLSLPLLIWPAFRFGPREVATGNALLSGLAIWGTLQGFGPFLRPSPNESLLLLQAFTAVVGVTTLAVAAAVSLRRRAEHDLSRTAAIVDSSQDAIVLKTLDGTIASWNGGAQRLYGYPADEVVGRSISILIPPDRSGEMHVILDKVRTGKRVDPYETVRVRKDGKPVAVSVGVSPVRDASGEVVGASAIARDITERKRAERHLVTQLEVTRILTEATSLRDAAPQLLDALCDGFEWDRGELWTASGGQLRCQARWPPAAPGADVLQPGEGIPGGAWESEKYIWADHGAVVFPQTSASNGVYSTAVAWPFRIHDEIAGVLALYSVEAKRDSKRDEVIALEDIGHRLGQFMDRERAFQGLIRLKKAVETIEMGVTITDMTGRILYTNAAEAVMHGYTVEELIGKHVSVFMPQVRQDTPRPSGIRSWKREIVNVRKDGTIFPVQLLSDAVTGPDGALIGIVTCCEEITERKRAEQALRSSEERYRLLFERNLAGVYRATTDGRLLECNEAFASILGYSSREEIIANSGWNLFFNRRDREACLSRLRKSGTLTNFELRMRRKDGSAVWVLENQTLLPARDGQDIVEGTLIDITERKLAEERVEFRAYHDALTGLPNRTFFRDRLHLALDQSRRSRRGFAVIFLDLDRFKEVNDNLGHVIGDRVLQEVAARLKESVREDDVVARLGGDEFVLLLPRVRHGEGAARIAKKILARMTEPFRPEGHELRVTASAGIALFPKDGEDPETLLKNADGAMYRAKELGRAAYQFHEPR